MLHLAFQCFLVGLQLLRIVVLNQYARLKALVLHVLQLLSLNYIVQVSFVPVALQLR